MPRQIFKRCVIASAGALPGQYTIQNLKHWTKIRKGQFVDSFDETVTHLLCTQEQFKAKLPRVKEALKRGKRFHLLHYDWYEFSTVLNKKQPERDYYMRTIETNQNAVQREAARIEKGKRDAEKFVNTNDYHIYRDREGFSYQIDIVKGNEEAGERAERYLLCLWESNAKPHLYFFTAKYLRKKGDSQPAYHRPSPYPRQWRPEFDLFTAFFRQKTKIDWEDRVALEKTVPSEFHYTPPTRGKPMGRRLRPEAKPRGLPLLPNSTDAAPEERPEDKRTTPDNDTSGLSDGPNEEMVLDYETLREGQAEQHEAGYVAPFSPASQELSQECTSHENGQVEEEQHFIHATSSTDECRAGRAEGDEVLFESARTLPSGPMSPVSDEEVHIKGNEMEWKTESACSD